MLIWWYINKVEIRHLELILFGDKLGTNISHEDNGVRFFCYKRNSGPCKAIFVAPVCTICGKDTLIIVTCTHKDGITSIIMKQALKQMDNLWIYKRSNVRTTKALFDTLYVRLQVTPYVVSG